MSRFQPYHLFRRTNSKGKRIHYVRFLDDDGQILRTLSSGLTNKVAAVRWAESKLPEIEEEFAAQRNGEIPTLLEYVEGYILPGVPYETRRTERGHSVAVTFPLESSTRS